MLLVGVEFREPSLLVMRVPRDQELTWAKVLKALPAIPAIFLWVPTLLKLRSARRDRENSLRTGQVSVRMNILWTRGIEIA